MERIKVKAKRTLEKLGNKLGNFSIVGT